MSGVCLNCSLINVVSQQRRYIGPPESMQSELSTFVSSPMQASQTPQLEIFARRRSHPCNEAPE